MMKTKILLLTVLLLWLGVFLTGCSCTTWTSTWGGSPCEKCETHWDWKGDETAATQAPCAAMVMSKTSQCYPIYSPKGDVVRLQKMTPVEVQANEPFDYSIKVTNLSKKQVDNVVVEDSIPTNLRFQSSTPTAKIMSDGSVRWHLGSIDAESSKMISASAIATGEGSIASCADVTYDRVTCAKIDVVQPRISLTKSAPVSSLKCDRIPLSYVVTNNGSGYACGITVSDQLSPGLVTSDGSNALEFSVDRLGPGESQQFEAMVDATNTGSYSSMAVAHSGTAGKAQSNMTTTSVSQPILAINQTCPDDQFIGRKMTYDMTVTNSGNAVAKNTVIVAGVPSGIQFHDASHGGVYSHNSPGRVTWNVGDIPTNSSKEVRLQLSSEQPGALVTTAKADAECAETVVTSCETVLSGIPAILLEVVDVSDPIKVNADEAYIISVTNQGSGEDTNISLQCTIENGMQYISSSGPTQASVEGNIITFEPLAKLGPKAKVQWRVNVKAVGTGDMRFKVIMNTDQISRPVGETEATRFYE